MVAHLHPRSRSTLSLFTTCLTVSFLVVGAPHILPCPVDRRNVSDSATDPATGEPRRRRRRRNTAPEQETDEPSGGGDGGGVTAEDVADMGPRRECPVPKPRGLIGQVMGFGRGSSGSSSSSSAGDEGEREAKGPTTVVVQSLRDRRQQGS
ncbi:hypothetical protein MBLNU459_g1877t1 [Dothideomycetes sp. NU459]